MVPSGRAFGTGVRLGTIFCSCWAARPLLYGCFDNFVGFGIFSECSDQRAQVVDIPQRLLETNCFEHKHDGYSIEVATR